MSAGNAVDAADWCRLSPQLAQAPSLRFVVYYESRLIPPWHPANLRDVAGLVAPFTLSHRALAWSPSAGRDQLSGVRPSGQTGLPGRPVRPRLDLLEPTIRQLLATISPLTQPRSEAWPERTTALLLTIPDASGRNVEILHRLTPATRHWATQSIHLLTACLTRMQLLPPLTPVPAANQGSSFSSSFGPGPRAL